MSDVERQEIYANMGSLLHMANAEIDAKGLHTLESSSTATRGSYAELVTFGASAHPNSTLLYPTPQRGFRRADAQLPCTDVLGRNCERLIDIKIGDTSGTRRAGAPNRLRVGRIASEAVYAEESPSASRADVAWAALQTIGDLVARDSHGLPISRSQRTTLELFAWAIPKRVELLNDRTGITGFLRQD